MGVDWNSASDADWLLDNSGEVSDRKLRLFAVACCRDIWPMLDDKRSRRAVEVAERFADGEASIEELNAARLDSRSAKHEASIASTRDAYSAATCTAARSAKSAALDTYLNSIWAAAWAASGSVIWLDSAAPGLIDNRNKKVKHFAAIYRDIVLDPSRPVVFDPRWRTSDVVAIARGIYDDRAFDRMPILVDALMEAGCDSEDIIQHCLGSGPHARGCWVVDLILEKK